MRPCCYPVLQRPLIVLFGMYVGLHAMTTPGGGFQGGVIIASGLLLVLSGPGLSDLAESNAFPLA